MSDQPATETPQVQFSYIKCNSFRVVHVDGAIGALTPRGLIFASLYSERQAIPRVLVHEVQKGFKELGKVVHTDTRGGYVRELEVGLMLDRETAAGLRDWLNDRIGELDKVLAERANA